MLADADHAELARRQVELVAALSRGAPSPPGFSGERLALAADRLRWKRLRGVSRIWPELRLLSGRSFARLFHRYARNHPAGCGSLGDGRAFVAWLILAGELSEAELPPAARLELLRAELAVRLCADGRAVPRTGFWFRVVASLPGGGVAVGIRLPGGRGRVAILTPWWRPPHASASTSRRSSR